MSPLALIVSAALGAGLSDHGEDLYARETLEYALHGYARTRGEALENLDLDRGITPSGRGLYATPVDPSAQWLETADLRVRTDLALYAFFAPLAVKVRTDLIDNLVIASTPAVNPGTGAAFRPGVSTAQLPAVLFRIKRAYVEVLTPVGYLAAGRMGPPWGLGLLAHSGDCLDCDSADAADRIAFVTPLLGHLFAAAYDFDAIGPLSTAPDAPRYWVLEPSVSVRSLSFAVMNRRSRDALERRREAGKTSVEYGLLGSYRWQDTDTAADGQPLPRGFKAGVFDGWLRVLAPALRVELEGALAVADVEQPSLIPGVLLRDHVASLQWGGALEVELGAPSWRVTGGVMTGVASGDPSPGFGAFPSSATRPVVGELDAPQASVPRDTRVDNLRFNPDYRVDRILFAKLIGTVTDAVYVRPWAQARLVDLGTAALKAQLAATWSRALYAASTPGQDPRLGLELQSALRWEAASGFDALLEYAVLFPFAGLSQPGTDARPAQLLRLRLAWVF